MIAKKHLDWANIYSSLQPKAKYVVNKLLISLSSGEMTPAAMRAVRKAINKTKPIESDGRKQPNSYMVFKHELAPMLKKEHPDMKAMDIGRLVGKKWNEQSPEEKKEYDNKAKKQKIEFKNQQV